MNNISKEVKDVLIMNQARKNAAIEEHNRLKEEAFKFKLRKVYNEDFAPVADNWTVTNTAQPLMPDDPNLSTKPLSGKWISNQPTSDSDDIFPFIHQSVRVIGVEG